MLNWQLKHFDQLTLQQLYDILRLRQEVFVLEQNCPFVDNDEKDQPSHHLMGWAGNHLAAYARIVPPGKSYAEPSIGRVVTSGKYRRTGMGKELMSESIMALEKLYGKSNIRIGAQLYLERFYGSFGFVRQGDIYLEDGIEHIIMLRTATEAGTP